MTESDGSSDWRQALLNRRMLICIFTGFSSGLPLYLLLQLAFAVLVGVAVFALQAARDTGSGVFAERTGRRDAEVRDRVSSHGPRCARTPRRLDGASTADGPPRAIC